MKLIEDWRVVLRHAWSVRFGMLGFLFYVTGFLIDLGGVLPMMKDVLPPNVFFILSLLSATAGFMSRFIQQPNMEDKDAATDTPPA